ncbi:CDP-alcohol phosphatidyltransferase family protein [Aequorivita antarctica]|uniref:CDP-alcohol phosphatidyltransferase family protein n=1 Tax=Aequorivita antarctica TaxID=153266 RepID=A0A5C6Z0C5_9FLAO|nr:CDP-alcohol phosphatidyltransferase family protein [Aequorivita antarctica]TXD73458.1 CDP-alcohol phosphatidyltransferase family protein [Aequorivita antarctica]SRX75755.1 CDP-diacylglycerol--glycerol-3-phosphate 3-phosphatidyltransferase [Aequorivita antarctica]
MLTFKNFNIADWFSFYRVAVAPFLFLLIFLDFRILFTWFLLVSYLTDAIDGYLARKLKITSARGSQLDSFGDQVTLIIGIIGLFFFEPDFIQQNLTLLLIVFVPYGIQMFIAYKKYGKATAFHTYLAKLSAITQAVFILWLLFFGPVYWLFYFMVVLGLIETAEEITLIFLYDKWVAGVKGLYWALRDKRRLEKSDNTSNKKQ